MEEKDILITSPPDYKAEIEKIIRSNLTPKRMRDALLEYHVNDIAATLVLLQKDERNRLYSVLDTDTLSGVLEYADTPGTYLGEMPIRKRVEILSRFEVVAAVEYLEFLEKDERDTVLELMQEEPRSKILLLASFDKEEIGSKMTTNYIAISASIGVREAMTELIAQAAENDNVSTLYVIDKDGTFVGAIDLKDLIRARSDSPLDDIIMTTYPYVYANEPIDSCLERIKMYSEDSIPVLDADNKLQGVLTAQDLAQVIEDEIGDDYAKLGGLSSEEDLQEPLHKSIGKRLPWLIVLFGLGLLVSGVVGMFETVVASLTLIVSFQSLILGMAGNAGTQSLAVTIRLLMDENLSGKQKFFLVCKEARVGFCNGFLLGFLSFLLVGLYLFLRGEAIALAFSVSLCIGVALLISMFLSSLSGTTIPILLKKLKIDPAVASGPFITTINDLVAVVTYYGLAWLLLLQI